MSLGETDDLVGDAVSPWPAFADLLAASTLLFLVLFAVVAIPAIVENGVIKAKRNTLESLQDSLQRGAERGHFNVQPVGNYLLIRIAGDATFPRNASDLGSLKEEGREILRSFAKRVRDANLLSSIDQIQVVGHTSSEGSDAHNWQLSSERAASVALFLIQEGELPACSVTATGRGRFYPVSPDSARKVGGVRAEDRRIELELTPVILGDSAQVAQHKRCVEVLGAANSK